LLKKSILLFIAVVLVLTVSACSTNSGNNEAPDLESDYTEDTSLDNGSSEESHDPDTFVFVPSVAVPEDLPIYPDAELWSDMPAGEECWQWLYQTTGSGNDIVEFFVDALQDLGFDIDSEYTFAEREEFSIITTDNIVGVYWLGSDESEDLTADTPNRGYGIFVHQEGWGAR